MAIIDRPKTDDAEAPKPTSGIISKPSQTNGGNYIAEDYSQLADQKQAKSGGSFLSWFKWVLLVLILGVVTTLAVPYLKQVSFEHEVSLDNVALEVDRLIRIDSVIALLEKKIEQNRGSLKRSEKVGDKLLVDTMRLALAQNLIDLDAHQESYIDALVSLNETYQVDSTSVVSVLKDQLKSSSDAYKLGRVNTIQKALELMESIPEDKTAKTYFSEKIKKQNKEI